MVKCFCGLTPSTSGSADNRYSPDPTSAASAPRSSIRSSAPPSSTASSPKPICAICSPDRRAPDQSPALEHGAIGDASRRLSPARQSKSAQPPTLAYPILVGGAGEARQGRNASPSSPATSPGCCSKSASPRPRSDSREPAVCYFARGRAATGTMTWA